VLSGLHASSDGQRRQIYLSMRGITCFAQSKPYRTLLADYRRETLISNVLQLLMFLSDSFDWFSKST
jgi:hypothetical protein